MDVDSGIYRAIGSSLTLFGTNPNVCTSELPLFRMRRQPLASGQPQLHPCATPTADDAALSLEKALADSGYLQGKPDVGGRSGPATFLRASDSIRGSQLTTPASSNERARMVAAARLRVQQRTSKMHKAAEAAAVALSKPVKMPEILGSMKVRLTDPNVSVSRPSANLSMYQRPVLQPPSSATANFPRVGTTSSAAQNVTSIERSMTAAVSRQSSSTNATKSVPAVGSLGDRRPARGPPGGGATSHSPPALRQRGYTLNGDDSNDSGNITDIVETVQEVVKTTSRTRTVLTTDGDGTVTAHGGRAPAPAPGPRSRSASAAHHGNDHHHQQHSEVVGAWSGHPYEEVGQAAQAMATFASEATRQTALISELVQQQGQALHAQTAMLMQRLPNAGVSGGDVTRTTFAGQTTASLPSPFAGTAPFPPPAPSSLGAGRAELQASTSLAAALAAGQQNQQQNVPQQQQQLQQRGWHANGQYAGEILVPLTVIPARKVRRVSSSSAVISGTGMAINDENAYTGGGGGGGMMSRTTARMNAKAGQQTKSQSRPVAEEIFVPIVLTKAASSSSSKSRSRDKEQRQSTALSQELQSSASQLQQPVSKPAPRVASSVVNALSAALTSASAAAGRHDNESDDERGSVAVGEIGTSTSAPTSPSGNAGDGGAREEGDPAKASAASLPATRGLLATRSSVSLAASRAASAQASPRSAAPNELENVQAADQLTSVALASVLQSMWGDVMQMLSSRDASNSGGDGARNGSVNGRTSPSAARRLSEAERQHALIIHQNREEDRQDAITGFNHGLIAGIIASSNAGSEINRPPSPAASSDEGALTDELVLQAMTNALMRAEQETGLAHAKSLRENFFEMQQQLQTVSQAATELQAGEAARADTHAAFESRCAAVHQSAEDAKAAADAALVELREHTSQTEARLTFTVQELQHQVEVTSGRLADAVTDTQRTIEAKAIADAENAAVVRKLVEEVQPTMIQMADEIAHIKNTVAAATSADGDDEGAEKPAADDEMAHQVADLASQLAHLQVELAELKSNRNAASRTAAADLQHDAHSDDVDTADESSHLDVLDESLGEDRRGADAVVDSDFPGYRIGADTYLAIKPRQSAPTAASDADGGEGAGAGSGESRNEGRRDSADELEDQLRRLGLHTAPAAAGSGPSSSLDIDVGELSAGEIVMTEDFQPGQTVQLVPVVRRDSSTATAASAGTSTVRLMAAAATGRPMAARSTAVIR